MSVPDKDLRQLSQEQLILLYVNLLKEHTQLKHELHKLHGKPKVKYDGSWSWMKKITYGLLSLDKPSSSAEIITELKHYDDYFDHYNDEVKSFSTFITRACAYNVIVKVKIGGFKGYHYALPQWCNEQGELLKKYRNKVSLI